MKLNWKKLYRSIDSIRKETGESWRKFAKARGVDPMVYSRMSKGHAVSVRNLLKAAIGVELSQFIEEKDK